MFNRIMTPVDLAHRPKMERGLKCSADLARTYGIPVVYVGVTASTPGALGHTPEEYREKLEEFAREEASAEGIQTSAHMVVSHDPTTDLDDVLLKALDQVGADLVVMSSHVPGLTDYIWPSNGGKIAAHASASVMLVRG
ncbi:universal stress protein [Albibacillus kandeliae]|uniref:universal stress protein n=1 Tax=Albibacillus kandeliae TaxID=2174228 RepID=UPI000D68CCB7|nr:universal stress protein [Albibacillus kandeliae]